MTTLEYMEKELEKHKRNYECQVNRQAPEKDIENIRNKIEYYSEVCGILRLYENGNVIFPHCKVGDKVYYISENPRCLSVQANRLYEAEVVRIVTTRLGTSLVIQIHNEYGCTEIPDVNEWGKTVFSSVKEFTKRYLDTTDLEKAVEHLTKYKELKEAEQAMKGGCKK